MPPSMYANSLSRSHQRTDVGRVHKPSEEDVKVNDRLCLPLDGTFFCSGRQTDELVVADERQTGYW